MGFPFSLPRRAPKKLNFEVGNGNTDPVSAGGISADGSFGRQLIIAKPLEESVNAFPPIGKVSFIELAQHRSLSAESRAPGFCLGKRQR